MRNVSVIYKSFATKCLIIYSETCIRRNLNKAEICSMWTNSIYIYIYIFYIKLWMLLQTFTLPESYLKISKNPSLKFSEHFLIILLINLSISTLSEPCLKIFRSLFYHFNNPTLSLSELCLNTFRTANSNFQYPVSGFSEPHINCQNIFLRPSSAFIKLFW
jgi:hypothetical protein